MGLFKKNKVPGGAAAQTVPTGGAPPRTAAWASGSEFIKQADCGRCGAPKTLPSKTAYLYCDHCGALVDYDFRIANADPTAPSTNMVYQQLAAALRPALREARLAQDRDRYRELQSQIFGEWIARCPAAVSPRAKSDEEFRARMVAYLAATAASKDLDPRQAPLDDQMALQVATLQRVPTATGPQIIGDAIWRMAALFKQQMEMAYALIHEQGIDALDPDDSPPGVPLSMEYSTFCQGFLPQLSPTDGERLIGEFGLTGRYTRFEPPETNSHSCGGCGGELHTVVGARVVVCENCGRRIDVAGGNAPCQNCGAPLSFPESSFHLSCPYCRARPSTGALHGDLRR
jgi:DNA-directed RNA polymerase subunit RPC12/RpoP